ncbi:MAG: Serine--tRNA ligase [Parcubacteria group bacterium ADurb.Bin159]|nr:MAG: Serine--tRNA ligase [Parcubacteria group bacterium ADurb.Bin159]
MNLKFILQNIDKVKNGLEAKGVKVDIDKLIELDKQRKEILPKIEEIRAKQNKISGKPKEKEIYQLQELKKERIDWENKLKKIEKEIEEILSLVPNLPLESVPRGKSEKDNRILRKVGKIKNFSFTPKNYLEIGEENIDTERAAKISGTRFAFLKGDLVRLQFALIRFVLDFLSDKKNLEKIIKNKKLNLLSTPFIPILPPVLLQEKIMKGMGYVERGREEIYWIEKDKMCLVGTAEQSIGPMHKDEILEEKKMPFRYVGYSSCFRREAGSYGKDTKGILRVHQFDKLEMFSFCQPQNSNKEHQLFLALEEEMVQKLSLPYQVIETCTADLGDPAAAKFDIETWIPSEKKYRETHSTSNCTDFQAERLNIRFRDKNGDLRFVHTVNGTAFALGRIIIAILENYQKKDGGFGIPKVLKKYF